MVETLTRNGDIGTTSSGLPGPVLFCRICNTYPILDEQLNDLIVHNLISLLPLILPSPFSLAIPSVCASASILIVFPGEVFQCLSSYC